MMRLLHLLKDVHMWLGVENIIIHLMTTRAHTNPATNAVAIQIHIGAIRPISHIVRRMAITTLVHARRIPATVSIIHTRLLVGQTMFHSHPRLPTPDNIASVAAILHQICITHTTIRNDVAIKKILLRDCNRPIH